MIRNVYTVLILTLPYSISYNYDIDQEENYQPKVHKKVRGRQKYYNYGEVPKVDNGIFDAYSDDMEPMAQLDLMSFLNKPSEDFFADNTLEPNNMGKNLFKHKRGISRKSNVKRKLFINDNIAHGVPQIVSVDRINPKYQHENFKRNNENSHILSGHNERKNFGAEVDLTYNGNEIKRDTDINPEQHEENRYFDLQSKLRQDKGRDLSSDFADRNNKRKSKNMVYPMQHTFNRHFFNGNGKQKKTRRKDVDYGSSAVYQHEKRSQNMHTKMGNHENKKLTKKFKFPFFSRDNSDTKRHKKRKLFCSSKKITIPTSSTLSPEVVTANVPMRGYEVCPMCQAKFVSQLRDSEKHIPIVKTEVVNEGDSPVIQNSRQYFKLMSRKRPFPTQSSPNKIGSVEDLERKENSNAKYCRVTGTQNKKGGDLEQNQNKDFNKYERRKRQQLSFDRNRQFKELEEVQRKVDSVHIKGITIKSPLYL